MNRSLRPAAALLALALLLSLCACGATEPKPEPVPTPPSVYLPYVGDYTLFGVRHGDYIVDPAAMEIEIHSVLTLLDGGMGMLSINETSGRIGSWTISGEKIILNPDSSPISGLYRDGIVILTMEDGSTLYYAAEGADRSAFPLIGKEEYTAILAAEALAEAEREAKRRELEAARRGEDITIPGVYYMYSFERDGETVNATFFGSSGDPRITLREDGSGEIHLSGGDFSFDWSYVEGVLSFRERSGLFGDLSPVLLRDGVLTMTVTNQNGSSPCIFARMDADLTDIDELAEIVAPTAQTEDPFRSAEPATPAG